MRANIKFMEGQDGVTVINLDRVFHILLEAFEVQDLSRSCLVTLHEAILSISIRIMLAE